MKYVIAPTGADIMHYGKGHDDNPPGRGSGRWAWGSSGKNKKKSSEIGTIQENISNTVQTVTDVATSTEAKHTYKAVINAAISTAIVSALTALAGVGVGGAIGKILISSGTAAVSSSLNHVEDHIMSNEEDDKK